MSKLLKPGYLHEQIGAEETVKALSWRQPYAQLMFSPHNKIETRVWDTSYRGLVLICATQKMYNDNELFAVAGSNRQFERIKEALSLSGTPGSCFSGINGCAIGIGRLVNSRPMTEADADRCFVDYREKRLLLCHIYEDVHFIEPFKFKGGQKWTNLSQEDIKSIKIYE